MLDPSTRTGAKAVALIADAHVIWLTTVHPNGQPQSSPVWFVVEGDQFLMFSLAATARTRNIQTNPRVSLNLDSKAGADVVTIEGRARLVTGTTSLNHANYQIKYANDMARIGHTPESFADRYPVAIKVAPTRWRVH